MVVSQKFGWGRLEATKNLDNFIMLKASPVAMHLHFLIHNADADAGLGPSHYDSCKSRMKI